MKAFFIFLNLILFVLVVVLLVLHITRKPLPPEKILASTPSAPDVGVASPFDFNGSPLSESELAIVVDSELFSSSRGQTSAPGQQAPADLARLNREKLELSGIFRMGNIKGATILNSFSGPSGQANRKNFFMVGDKIGDTPYMLHNINPEDSTAVISMGSSLFSLKIDRDSTGSLQRRSQATADSKALSSLSAASARPALQPSPDVPAPTAQGQDQESDTAREQPQANTTDPPPQSTRRVIQQRSPEEMKRIREEILKKMQERRGGNP
ncbi:MAG: hypothetical protein JW808_08415 [Victivallales bacterium]|nr:hypothetical protein [Victivallales bacterium]